MVLALAAFAQTNLEVYKAKLSVPFGEAEGKLLAVNDNLVFVDDDKPEFSFVIERGNIADLSKNDSVVTIQTKRMIKDRSGERMRFVFLIKDGKQAIWSNGSARILQNKLSSAAAKCREATQVRR